MSVRFDAAAAEAAEAAERRAAAAAEAAEAAERRAAAAAAVAVVAAVARPRDEHAWLARDPCDELPCVRQPAEPHHV